MKTGKEVYDMKSREYMMSNIFTIDSVLNPENNQESHSYSSCEDRCNKLEVRRSTTHGAYS